MDHESLEAIFFVARRIAAEDIRIVLAVRDGANELTDSTALPRLRIDGLCRSTAGQLLVRSAANAPAPDVIDRLVADARGNPLALTELARSLTPPQLAGREPLPDPLPVGAYLQRAFLRSVRDLTPVTQRALLIASADDGSGLLDVALHAEGVSRADLEEAERAGVVSLHPSGPRFAHPLVRAAVYQSASASERRSAHRALAVAAHGTDTHEILDRRAWHLALASTGPNPTVAAALEHAAGRAAARNAYMVAADAFSAAARLSPHVVDRGRLLGLAGQCAVQAGAFARAAALLDAVIGLEADPQQVGGAIASRAHVETWGGSCRKAVNMLIAAADRFVSVDPYAAAAFLTQAMLGSTMRGEVDEARLFAERAAMLAKDAPPGVNALVEVALASALMNTCEPRRISGEAEAELIRMATNGDPVAWFWSVSLHHRLMLEERYSDALDRTTTATRAARMRSTPSALPYPLTVRAEVLGRLGRLHEARADAGEAADIAGETGQLGVRGWALGTLARIEAILGRTADCCSHAEAGIEGLGESEADSLPIFAEAALGLLALGEPDPDRAVIHLSDAARRTWAGGRAHPLLVPFEQDLIETLIRLGRIEEAERQLAALNQKADAIGVPWVHAAVARCRGLLAPSDAFEAHFAKALEFHAHTPTPFERARTLLCLGERRRQARRMKDAREPLNAALETFAAIGAAPWAEWARRELRVTGVRPRSAGKAATGELTPQELRVALAVAEGATNKEVATALFISPKTVEYHLGHVFAKLGVRTRAELAYNIARAGTTIPA